MPAWGRSPAWVALLSWPALIWFPIGERATASQAKPNPSSPSSCCCSAYVRIRDPPFSVSVVLPFFTVVVLLLSSLVPPSFVSVNLYLASGRRDASDRGLVPVT